MLNSFFYLVIFLFGLSVGSFLNCIIYRFYIKEKVAQGKIARESIPSKSRSYCPNCKHILNWQDLIPLFSFLFLKGRCRYCHKKISWQYPLVEIATGILFLIIFIFNVAACDFKIFSFPLIFYWIITCFLIIIFVYDLKHYIIPDKVIYPAIAIAFLYQLFRLLNIEFVSSFKFQVSSFKILINPLFSAILASAFFLIIVLLSRGRWMGLGDVKLAFFMGLFLGFPNILPALFLAFFIGAIIGVALIAFGRKTLKSEVPFGPFLVTGTFVVLFWGENLINWYLNLF